MPYIWTDSQFELVLICLVYTSIFVFGLVGNLKIICIAFRDRAQLTVTNVFMSNLAVANVVVCLFILPKFPLTFVMKNWPQCFFTCHLWPCIYHSVCYASILTLASISLFRCRTIETQNKIHLTMVISLIWFVSLIISLPRGIFNFLKEFKVYIIDRYYVCEPQWPSDSSRQHYLMNTFIIMMVIPLVVIVFCFIAISIKLSLLSTSLESSTESQKRIRTNRLIAIMAVLFVVCWMPRDIIDMESDIYKSPYIRVVLAVVDVIEMSSTCFNPLLYVWLNDLTIKRLYPCFNHSSNRSNNEEVVTVDTSLPTYDEAVTYNKECDTVDIPFRCQTYPMANN